MRFASVISLVVASAAGTVYGQLTPQQRAGANGAIPNPSAGEFYAGPAPLGSSNIGFINRLSLVWYKFTADGQSGVVFDLFGSDFSFGGSFGSRNDGELALFNSTGGLVASTESPKAPSTGDSTLMPPVNPGDPPLGRHAYRQPEDPREPAVNRSGSSWSGGNAYNLSQLAFVNNRQANPLWNPAHPQHNALDDWDEYGILPAGDYFLAVTGYSTHFSGSARDAAAVNSFGQGSPNANGPVTSTTPFGFVTFSEHSGIYQLNARKPGDLDLDGDADFDDRELLKSKIAQFKDRIVANPDDPGGIPAAGFANNDPTGDWFGLPADLSDPGSELARFDLTANSRIDKFDRLQWGRWTGLAAGIPGDADLDEDVDFDDLLTLSQNYGLLADAHWTIGDFDYDEQVQFSDLLALSQNYGVGVSGVRLDFAAALAQLPPSVASAFAQAIPEPGFSLLAGLTFHMIVVRRRHRRTKDGFGRPFVPADVASQEEGENRTGSSPK